MQIIDRYLLRQFLKTFVICYLSLTGLYIVFDAFTNLEEFLRCGHKAGGVLPLMCSFYGYQSILFFDRTAGLLALVSAMFTVTWIQRHNEMTALMAAGVSRIRIVLPVIIAAGAISVLAAASREAVIPHIRKELSRRPQDLVGDVGQQMSPVYDRETNILMRGEETFRENQRIESPSYLLPPALSHYAKQVTAKVAFYQRPQGDRPGGYLCDGVEQPEDLAERESLMLNGNQPVIITPHDRPDWLEADQCFLVSNVNFEQLTGGRAIRQFSSTPELVAGLHNPSVGFGADVEVAIHTRVLNPFLDLTLLFLGLPLVVSRESRNVFLAIGMCMGVVSVFLLVVIGCQHLGSAYLIPPALAAWLPLILFVPPAVGSAHAMWR